MRWSFAFLFVFLDLPSAIAGEWRFYEDPSFGYSIVVPEDGFDGEARPSGNGLTLFERGGRGQIDVYAVRDESGFDLVEMRKALGQTERIKQITYSRAGGSWFVVSGYYNRPASEDTDLIFYAKFIMSNDRTAIAAFEASYPESERRRFDPIIERMEDSLAGPD